MTQRPDLFAVALANAGPHDMLRFHKFTVGAGWIPEYGSPDDPAGFRYLRAYSPLQNVRPGTCYPATLLLTADHDDRVVPSHSYKFAAALQAALGVIDRSCCGSRATRATAMPPMRRRSTSWRTCGRSPHRDCECSEERRRVDGGRLPDSRSVAAPRPPPWPGDLAIGCGARSPAALSLHPWGETEVNEKCVRNLEDS